MILKFWTFSEWLLQLHQDLVSPQGWSLGVWYKRLQPMVHLESCKYCSDNNDLHVCTMEVTFPTWNITSPAVNKHMLDVLCKSCSYCNFRSVTRTSHKMTAPLMCCSLLCMAGVKDYNGRRNEEIDRLAQVSLFYV